MELTFLGTRGGIKIRSRRHRRHSALLIRHNGARVMIDCGADWIHHLRFLAPTAIVLTHAHPDHAWGLADGAPCPVYATTETSSALRNFPVRNWRRMPIGRAMVIGGVRFKAFSVQHSLRAPAVAYRVSAKGWSFFYLPDVAVLPGASRALHGIDIYIGDGATITRPMVRRQGGTSIGHASIATQLAWCHEAHVRKALFTHCGSQILHDDGRRLNAFLQRRGREVDVDARLVCDGYRLSFPNSGAARPREKAKRRA